MFNGHSVLVVIPARGGSKGIPLKNIAPLAGRPLLDYTTELARTASWADACVVSTDHAKIASIAQKVPGIDVVWRPQELAGDAVGDTDVLKHALKEAVQAHNHLFDIIVMLQPTSPLRTLTDVTRTLELLIEGDADAVWTLSPTDPTFHPLKQLKLSEDNELSFFDPIGIGVIARQQLSAAYHRNGVAYALRSDFLTRADSLYAEGKTLGVVVDGPHISIDTPEDLALVEAALLQKPPSVSPIEGKLA